MTAAFILPMAFTPSSADPSSTLPISNANIDAPAMMYKCGGNGYFIADLGRVRTIDTVAMVGNNLAAGDIWRIRTSITQANAADDHFSTANLSAWSGFAFEGARADSINVFSPVQARYIRVDFTNLNLTFQRLVIGLSVQVLGVDYDAEKTFDDQSVITSGANYRSVDEYPVLSGWKVNLSWIKETAWRQSWEPMFLQAGQKKGVLFIPDITQPDQYQTDAIFGCINGKPAAKCEFYDGWSVNPSIIALSSKLIS